MQCCCGLKRVFRDRQRYNGNLRLAHGSQHRFQAIHLRMQRVLHYANHAGGPGIGRHFRHRIEAILIFQIGDLLLAANQVNFGVSPVAAVFRSQNIRINGLMRTMKRAESQVNNSRNQRVAIPVRNGGIRV